MTIETLAAPAAAGTRRAARLADAADELRAAFAWAKQRLAANPQCARRRRRAGGRRAACTRSSGWRPSCRPSSAGRRGGRSPQTRRSARPSTRSLSRPRTRRTRPSARWLRSPFFAAPREESFARARLDTDLRLETALAALVPRRVPLRRRRVARGASAELGARARGRARRGRRHSARDAEPVGASHGAVSGRRSAGSRPPRAPRCSRGRARSTSCRGSRRSSARSRSTRHWWKSCACSIARRPPFCRCAACTCCARIDDVGPGYDAVWVTGFTDAAWPEPPRGNPLLPIALQRAHGMPYASPRDAQERSARALEPPRPAQPRARHQLAGSRLRLRDGAEPGDSRLARALAGRARCVDGGSAAARRGARDGCATTRRRSPARAFAGGTGVLGRQARCPLRAFCQDRLGARAARAARLRRAGAAARHRGASRGRAACSRTCLRKRTSPTRRTPSRTASSEPLAKLFGRARAPLAALYELEAEQLKRVLAALLRAEALRAPFRVRAVEQRATVTVGPLTFDVRIDRIDELAGRHAGHRRLQDERASDERRLVRAAAARRPGPALREPVGRDGRRGGRRAAHAGGSALLRFLARRRVSGARGQSGASRRRRHSSRCGARSSRSSRPSSRPATRASSSPTTRTRRARTRH